jgi:hypothetical protein
MMAAGRALAAIRGGGIAARGLPAVRGAASMRGGGQTACGSSSTGQPTIPVTGQPTIPVTGSLLITPNMLVGAFLHYIFLLADCSPAVSNSSFTVKLHFH